MSEHHEVVIAGGGIAGLAAALAFRKAGYRTVVFERASTLAPLGAGILLQANGLVVLDALGLGDRVRAQGTAMPQLLLRDPNGGRLVATEFRTHLPPLYWPVCIHRAGLHSILWQACASADVAIHLGAAVTSIDQGGTGATRATCETPDGTVSVTGNVIVGADGVRSAVRSAIGIPVRLWPIMEGSVQGVLPYSVQPDCHGEYLGGSEACGMLPMGPDSTFWFWGNSSRTEVGAASREFESWRNDVCRKFPPMRSVLSSYDGWSEVVRLQHRSVRCEAWSSGNVVLIGDAAHAMSPNLGQGANCALVDALALVGHVATGNLGSDLPGAFTRFERDRRHLVDGLQQQGYRESASALARWPGSEAFNRLALWLSGFASASQQYADILAMSGLDGSGFGPAAAGVRSPIPW